MKKNYPNLHLKTLALVWLSCFFFGKLHAQLLTFTFNATGAAQSFTVPGCVSLIHFDVRGAAGANSNDKLTSNSVGGLGGRVEGDLMVTPGQVINLFVGVAGSTTGIGGFNGGGNGGNSTAGSGACSGGYAGGGGGASDIRVGGITLADRIAVAAGGGGAGRDYCNGSCLPCGCGGSGGAGGGLSGLIGQAANNCGYLYPGTGVNGGAGGTALAAGAGAPGDAGGNAGTSGALGSGGNGAAGTLDVAGGGGGGGYYGGGGGGGASSGSGVGGGGGGGGSSYLGTLMNATTTQSFQTGDGIIILSYNFGLPSLTISGTNGYICSGSTLTLTASGATSYTWNTGATSNSIVVAPTANTTYSVIGSSTAACPPYAMIQTSVVALPVVTASTSAGTSVCPGTNVTLTGGGTHIYSWSGGVSNGQAFPAPLVSTIYTVTGTNTITGCSNNATILVPVYPTAFSVSNSTAICKGNSINLTATGGINYSWSTGQPFQTINVSPTLTTVYTVTITSSDFCVGTNTVMVTVNPLPPVTSVCTRTSICRGESTVINASGATTYSWSNSATAPSITVSPQSTTSYTVYGSASGCTGTSSTTVKVTVCVGIDEFTQSGQNLLSIYPNPNKGEFTISAKGEMDLHLVNELGQVIRVLHLESSNHYQTTVKDLPAGIYFAVSTNKDLKVNQKIVVND